MLTGPTERDVAKVEQVASKMDFVVGSSHYSILYLSLLRPTVGILWYQKKNEITFLQQNPSQFHLSSGPSSDLALLVGVFLRERKRAISTDSLKRSCRDCSPQQVRQCQTFPFSSSAFLPLRLVVKIFGSAPEIASIHVVSSINSPAAILAATWGLEVWNLSWRFLRVSRSTSMVDLAMDPALA